jgi:hypothetical protein
MRRRHRPAGAAGQGLAEFAMIFPVMIVLIFVVIDGGRAVFAYNAAQDAAKLASRVAIVDQGTSTDCVADAAARVAARSEAPHSAWCAAARRLDIIGSTTEITVQYLSFDYSSGTRAHPGSCSPVRVGCIAQVTVIHHFRLSAPGLYQLVNYLAPDGIDLQAVARLPVERVWS